MQQRYTAVLRLACTWLALQPGALHVGRRLLSHGLEPRQGAAQGQDRPQVAARLRHHLPGTGTRRGARLPICLYNIVRLADTCWQLGGGEAWAGSLPAQGQKNVANPSL